MESSKITHLTFDFFGTLVKYSPGTFSKEKAYKKSHRYLTDNGLTISYEDYIFGFGKAFDTLLIESKITNKEFHMRDVTQLFFSHYFGKISDEITDVFIELYIAEWNREVHFYPEMKSFLQKLKKKYSLSIISNTHYPSLVLRNLKKMGVSDYFDLIMTSVEYGIQKPDSRIFDETLKRLSIPMHSIVHIGDSYHDDYLGAFNAGIRCILIDADKKWEGKVKDRIDSVFNIEELL